MKIKPIKYVEYKKNYQSFLPSKIKKQISKNVSGEIFADIYWNNKSPIDSICRTVYFLIIDGVREDIEKKREKEI